MLKQANFEQKPFWIYILFTFTTGPYRVHVRKVKGLQSPPPNPPMSGVCTSKAFQVMQFATDKVSAEQIILKENIEGENPLLVSLATNMSDPSQGQ